MSEEALFNTDTLIVPQYLVLVFMGWLALTSMQQAKNITKLISKLESHLKEVIDDKKLLNDIHHDVMEIKLKEQLRNEKTEQ